MTVVAGCDVGSLTSKTVIMRSGRILGNAIIKSKPNPVESAQTVMQAALAACGINMADILCCIGTGYGRNNIPFVSDVKSEISCHGKGAQWLLPSARTVIDIGGQDCKTIRIDNAGQVVRFAANDKCASGTGRFLEVMSGVLDISVDELGNLSARATAPVTLASNCTVWAQADVIKFVNSGCPLADIGAGINTAMAKRVAILANSVKPESDIIMTGGVAKNKGVVSTLEKLLGHQIKKSRKADPQIAGAIGAALFALETINSR